MKIKNNLEKKIQSLNEEQLLYLKMNFNDLLLLIKDKLYKSNLFPEFYFSSQYGKHQINDKKVWNTKGLQISESFETKNSYKSETRLSDLGINIEFGVSHKKNIEFNVTGNNLQIQIKGFYGEIESSFWGNKIIQFNQTYWYLPFRPLMDKFDKKEYSDDNYLDYYELISFEKKDGNTLSLNSKERTLIKSINQVIYDYLEKIDSKLIEISNQKKKVQSKVKDLISKEFDKDSDGKLDIIQGDNLLIEILEKNESVIVEFDHTIIQKVIRLNKYLSLKKKNLQVIFEIFKKIDNDNDLKSFLTTFNQSISNYQSLLIHSLNMVISIKKKELISYYEIYESFDEVGVFNSNWENEISGKLSSIDFKLDDVISSINSVMYSIESMENRFTTSLDNLTYVTKSSYQSLQSSVTSELKSIRKGVGLNNLLTGINTFQLSQINKQTKGLIG